MGRTVVVLSGTIRDLAGFKALTEKATALVEEQLPGTETYEVYIDEGSSRFTAHEEYANGEAILSHLDALARAGVFAELPGLVDADFAVALGDPQDSRARAAIEDLGFTFTPLHARAAR